MGRRVFSDVDGGWRRGKRKGKVGEISLESEETP